MQEPTHFAFLLVPEFSHLAFSCALEPLRIANLVSGQELYRWSLLSDNGSSATCSNGSVTLVGGGLEPQKHVDRLFLISGINVHLHVKPEILRFLRRERAAGTPLGAICSGAYVLAKAGFLDGVETAVHWGLPSPPPAGTRAVGRGTGPEAETEPTTATCGAWV